MNKIIESFAILIFVILKFRNIGRSTFDHSEFCTPPVFIHTATVFMNNVQVIQVLCEYCVGRTKGSLICSKCILLRRNNFSFATGAATR